MNTEINQQTDSWLSTSWQRSRYAGLNESTTPEHLRLDNSQLQERIYRADLLLKLVTQYALPLFQQTLAQSNSRLILADNEGMIISSWGKEQFSDKLTDVALEPGVCWQESYKGTNAIGTALADGRFTSVIGQQHFISTHRFLSCTACPVFAPGGELLAILDITSEQQIHNPQIGLLIQTMVQHIESALLCHVPDAVYRFDLALSPTLLNTGWQGMVVTNEAGRILACNQVAEQLLQSQQLVGMQLSELWQQPWPPCDKNLHSVSTSDHAVSIKCNVLMSQPRTLIASSQLHNGDEDVERIWQQACKIIDKDIPLLILGETGAGKEQFVKQLHKASQRSQQPLVAVNCGSLPSELLESELFGYAPGAFTGASRQGYLGKIRQANGGILFLDEIAEMPLSAQSRLLRVLQEREVVPIGSNKVETVDIQIIAATHKHLARQVENGSFRQDLYYRLNGLTLELPALRDRNDLNALIKQLHQKYANSTQTIAPDLMDKLLAYSWPGNLRELDSVMKVASLLAEGEPELTLAAIPENLRQQLLQDQQQTTTESDTVSLKQSLQNTLVETYRSNGGNISKTARQLGISRNTLYRKLKGLGFK